MYYYVVCTYCVVHTVYVIVIVCTAYYENTLDQNLVPLIQIGKIYLVFFSFAIGSKPFSAPTFAGPDQAGSRCGFC